jgi:hypothetical protein
MYLAYSCVYDRQRPDCFLFLVPTAESWAAVGRRYPVVLLYWYKSTNTDAGAAAAAVWNVQVHAGAATAAWNPQVLVKNQMSCLYRGSSCHML